MRPRSVTARPTRTPPTFASPRPDSSTPTLVIGAAMILVACGSDSDDEPSAASTTRPSTSTSAPDSTSTAVVETVDNPDLGTILVDAEGKTLYTLTDDGGAAVACTGGCLAAWPPLLLPAGTTTATGGADVTDLGTTAVGSDQQVTHGGLPLYFFAGDNAAGDANGEGLVSFGGTWRVVKIGGSPSGDATTTTTTAQSGSPY